MAPAALADLKIIVWNYSDVTGPKNPKKIPEKRSWNLQVDEFQSTSSGFVLIIPAQIFVGAVCFL